MEIKKSTSLDIYDYEIYVRRRGDNDYASYCPQLNLMINGTEHEQVVQLMRQAIEKHIENLKKQSAQQSQ
jgi:flagellar motor component MotA